MHVHASSARLVGPLPADGPCDGHLAGIWPPRHTRPAGPEPGTDGRLTPGSDGPSIRGRATSEEAGASGIDALDPTSTRLTSCGAEPHNQGSAPCAAAPRRCTLTIEE